MVRAMAKGPRSLEGNLENTLEAGVVRKKTPGRMRGSEEGLLGEEQDRQ